MEIKFDKVKSVVVSQDYFMELKMVKVYFLNTSLKCSWIEKLIKKESWLDIFLTINSR